MTTYRNPDVAEALQSWFLTPGAYVLTDGQYGSTGKGVIAAAIAECFADEVQLVVSNAGPNSGHTSYFEDEKIILKQLPTFAVIAGRMGRKNNGGDRVTQLPKVFLSAGAVIDFSLLGAETADFGEGLDISYHPHVAVIDQNLKDVDRKNVSAIASTGQGVGPALVRKMKREPDGVNFIMDPSALTVWRRLWRRRMEDAVMFFEVSQGYSLGINSGFYPHVTTRECTVSQALSDAGLPPSKFGKSILSVRTFPIRVGSTENSSGPCYPDQLETDWAKLGVEPELTTVTKRVRRVFTWSDLQFQESVFANDPSVIFCNFMNYLRPEDQYDFIWNRVIGSYIAVRGRMPEAVLMGFGPRSKDIELFRPGQRW